MIGTTLSHFRITAKLGEGGMGEVYRAEDTKLGRDVAIKVLPEAVAGNPERLARFEREAKVLASLNHPNIAAIYSLESATWAGTSPNPTGARSVNFLVMELVDGETLSARIARGPLLFDDAGEIILQISEALEAAHAQGIIHRDLKPGNVMMTREGRVKVLDFGLAKRQIVETEADQEAPTATMGPVTREDQIVGTIPYMSPEQIRSQPLDPRSDLFSLGVMWFEMLTGTRPFDGDTSIDLMSSILKEETPDLSALRPDTPATLRILIEDCLAKPPDRRLGSATKLRQRLSGMMGASWRSEPPPFDTAGGSEAQVELHLDPSVIAVLPFDNLSGAEDAEFLATGLHNDLITELSRVESLTTISRSSVIRYRETEKTPDQIGHELSAGTIVEGTVQSIGDRVRLTAQLIDAAENAQKWAERYDRELSTETLFDLQSEVTRRIVDSLQSKLAPTLELPRGKPQTHDMEAYRLVTLGRVQVERRTEAGCRRAIEHFQAAVERDPDYPPAWAGLAEALAISVWYGYSERGERLERAQRAARRAVELDPDSAEAHSSLGTCLGAVRNGPAAVRELESAIGLQPSSWEAHSLLSYLHHLHGRARESYERAQRAVEINPLSAEAVNHLSLSLLTVGDPNGALKEARRASELSPGWTTAAFYESLALRELGRYDEAVALLENLTIEWAGLGGQATLALTHQAAGDEAKARRGLALMVPEVDAFAVGLVHLALGEIEAAFQRFDEAEHLTDWACLAVHHLYRDVWAVVAEDTRYRELVRRAFETHGFGPLAGDSND